MGGPYREGRFRPGRSERFKIKRRAFSFSEYRKNAINCPLRASVLVNSQVVGTGKKHNFERTENVKKNCYVSYGGCFAGGRRKTACQRIAGPRQKQSKAPASRKARSRRSTAWTAAVRQVAGRTDDRLPGKRQRKDGAIAQEDEACQRTSGDRKSGSRQTSRPITQTKSRRGKGLARFRSRAGQGTIRTLAGSKRRSPQTCRRI